MARRRRFMRSKTSPDRGWVVGFNNMQFEPNDGGPALQIGTLFDFADIDADALTGRIEQDKSDWFIKRVIFEAVAAFGTNGLTITDTARLWQLGLGTMSNDNANAASADGGYVISADNYNLWSRLFRSWSRPVYTGGLIGYTGDQNIATENVTTGGPTGGWSVTAPFWGHASIYEDFEVSNAGLRNNQSCIWMLSGSEGPGGYDWDPDDILYVTMNYRVLLQKRRM